MGKRLSKIYTRTGDDGTTGLGDGTRVQKAVGMEDSAEEMASYLRAVSPEPAEEKIRHYCADSVAHFDWLVAQGVPFNDTMYKGKHVLQMTDECLIWSGNEEAFPFRDEAKPAPGGGTEGTLVAQGPGAQAQAIGSREPSRE